MIHSSGTHRDGEQRCGRRSSAPDSPAARATGIRATCGLAGCGVAAAAVAMIPRPQRGGRPRKSDMQAAVNPILYLLRTDRPRRYLPRDHFPLRSTVYNIFRKFQKDGVWEAIWEELHMTLREQLGREASPTAAVIDSQSLKSAERGRF